jgi:hypothetical protein
MLSKQTMSILADHLKDWAVWAYCHRLERLLSLLKERFTKTQTITVRERPMGIRGMGADIIV